LPENLTARDHGTIAAWLVNSSKSARAGLLERLPRYAPELGWRAILSVLRRPESERHLDELARCLKWLVVQRGGAFIDRLEAESARSPRFRTCLGRMRADPGSPIPDALWDRLSQAAGTPVGPVSPSMSRLWEAMPDLTELLAADFAPLDPTNPPVLGADDLEALAGDWLTYVQTFWAHEEVERIVAEDTPERAWTVLRELIRASPDEEALGSIGAGPLENLLARDGDRVIDAIETAAATDPRVRYCIGNVWQREMSDALWSRLVTARGDEPQGG